MGSSFSSSSYAEWLYDAARQAGETTIVENDQSDSYVFNYYVVQIDSRTRDEAATADVRHVLVSAGSNPPTSSSPRLRRRPRACWTAGSPAALTRSPSL